MRYPIGFSTLGCPKWPWPKVLEQAAAMGYSSLEIRGIEGDMDLPKRPEFAARRLTDVRKDPRGQGSGHHRPRRFRAAARARSARA